jgi:S-sulfo-L-cysteine synthase (3-phospho-L-serine-dependent)
MTTCVDTAVPSGSRLVFVESNGTYGRAMASRAAAGGARITLLTRNPRWYADLGADDCEVVHVDTRNEELVAAVCGRLGGPLAVTAGFEPALATATAVARRLGLPGPDPDAVRIAATKDLMRARLRASNVRVPEFRVAHTPAGAARAFRAIRRRAAVVKPTATGGSIGVRLVESADAAAAHARSLLGRPDDRGTLLPHTVLVEEYLRGREYSAEILDGLAYGVTAKRTTPPPTFVEIGHDFPACAPAVAELAERAVHAVGLTWGPAHVEVMVDERGPAVIEINPRLAGGGISELIDRCVGADLFGAVVARLFGRTASLPGEPRLYGAIRSSVATERCRVIAADGVDAAAHRPGVLAALLLAAPGTRLGFYGDSRDRLATVSATGASAAAAAALADSALADIDVQVECEEALCG